MIDPTDLAFQREVLLAWTFNLTAAAANKEEEAKKAREASDKCRISAARLRQRVQDVLDYLEEDGDAAKAKVKETKRWLRAIIDEWDNR